MGRNWTNRNRLATEAEGQELRQIPENERPKHHHKNRCPTASRQEGGKDHPEMNTGGQLVPRMATLSPIQKGPPERTELSHSLPSTGFTYIHPFLALGLGFPAIIQSGTRPHSSTVTL